MRGNRYTQEQLAWIRQNHTLPGAELHARFRAAFNVDVTVKALLEQRKTLGLAGAFGRYKSLGADVIRKGLLHRKMNDSQCYHARFKSVHRINWELANGPVPNGMFLKCKGDSLNTDPSNWIAVSVRLIPRLYGQNGRVRYDDAPQELKPTILALAELECAVRAAQGDKP